LQFITNEFESFSLLAASARLLARSFAYVTKVVTYCNGLATVGPSVSTCVNLVLRQNPRRALRSRRPAS